MDNPLKKVVNALVDPSAMTAWAKVLLYWAVYPTIRRSGGLWVGGTVTVSDGRLRFEPNGLNQVFLAKDVSFSLPLSEIHSVRVDPGAATDIIVFATAGAERKVRCLGAKDFAAAIETAVASTRTR